MTDELERAVERLTALRDQARDGTPVTDPNEWEADELTDILSAVLDLLAANRKMRAALEAFAGLELPRRRGGNAGFYSIRFADVERARSALSTKED